VIGADLRFLRFTAWREMASFTYADTARATYHRRSLRKDGASVSLASMRSRPKPGGDGPGSATFCLGGTARTGGEKRVITDRRVGRLLSVNVGLPQDLALHGQMVRTAVWKPPVEGGRLVRRLNIDGAGQGDLADTAGGPVVHRHERRHDGDLHCARFTGPAP